MDEHVAVACHEEVADGYFPGLRSDVLGPFVEWEQVSETVGTIPIVFGIRSRLTVFRFANWVLHVDHVYRFAFFTMRCWFSAFEAELWSRFTTDRTHLAHDIKHLVCFTRATVRRCFPALEAERWLFFTTDST